MNPSGTRRSWMTDARRRGSAVNRASIVGTKASMTRAGLGRPVALGGVDGAALTGTCGPCASRTRLLGRCAPTLRRPPSATNRRAGPCTPPRSTTWCPSTRDQLVDHREPTGTWGRTRHRHMRSWAKRHVRLYTDSSPPACVPRTAPGSGPATCHHRRAVLPPPLARRPGPSRPPHRRRRPWAPEEQQPGQALESSG